MRAKFINEGLLEDIDKRDIIFNNHDKNINNYIFTPEDYVYMYKHEMNLDLEDDEILESNDFKQFLIDEIENRYSDIYYELLDLPDHDGNIKIWRIIMVNENWFNHFKKEGKRLGVYWSFLENKAEAHGGYNQKEKDIEIKFETLINEKNVNWINTIKANLNFNTGDEKELRLFKNTPIKLIKMWINDKEQDIKIFKNKIYKA